MERSGGFPRENLPIKNAERRTNRVFNSGKERGPGLGPQHFQNVGDVQKHTAGL
jgi:hypothetical protein